MNHELFDIKPLDTMPEDVRSGDVVSIYFPNTKVTGHINTVKPWGRHKHSDIRDGDDYLLCLLSSEGNSEGLGIRTPQYGINTQESTFLGKSVIGYSIVQRHWDYQIKGYKKSGLVHISDIFRKEESELFGKFDKIHGNNLLQGETIDGQHKIKGLLLAINNYGPTAGLLMYSDQNGEYIENAVVLGSKERREKLARPYEAHEILLGNGIEFSLENLQKIRDKKLDFIVDKAMSEVKIVQL
ncbi:MAG: hypothetical protein OQK82_07095 [Candidatus Pacearchaeota archaeon]|nr:hypothetical protein [Candidatus Pacearchaeota archaeon]